jgi:uncharacterized protein YjiK
MRIALLLCLVLALASAVDAQPTIVRSFPTATFGSNFPGGLGYDARNDHLWVIDETAKMAFEVTRTGSGVSSINLSTLGLTQPIGAGVDSKGQVLFVAEEINKKIWQIDLVTRAVITMTLISAYTDPSGLDYNPIAHSVITSDDGPDVIYEFDLATMQPITSLSVNGIANDADGLGCNTYNGLYIIGDDTSALIVEIADDGYVMNQWNTKTYGIQDPEGVCMDPANGNYFISMTNAPDTVYEVAGGLTLKPALTTDRPTVNKGEKVTFTFRTDSNRWQYGGIVLIAVGGGSIPPLILAMGTVDPRGHIKYTFQNPGLGGVKVTLIGGGFAVTPPYNFELSTLLDVLMN